MRTASADFYGPCDCEPTDVEHVFRDVISQWLRELIEDDPDRPVESLDLADIAALAGDLWVQVAGPSVLPHEKHERLDVHARGTGG